MTIEDFLRKAAKLKDFTLGVKSQRDHLNEIIAYLNGLRDAANAQAPGPVPGPVPNSTIWLAVDGIPTVFGIYLTGMVQP